MSLIDKVASSFMSKESVITNALQTTYADLTEPTYLVFEPIFNFNMQTGLLADESNKNSALAFLKRNGEMARYDKLKSGIETLKIILDQSPWIFNSVTGFNEQLDTEMNDLEIRDQSLKFDMWETLDMRVSNFIHSVLDATFDYNFRKVEILPRNLQEFSMGLLIHELRVFNDRNGTAKRALNQGTTENPTNVVNTNHILIHFGKCRIKRSSGNSIMAEFSNQEIEEAKINLEIEFKTLVRTHNFNTLANNPELDRAIAESRAEEAQEQAESRSLGTRIADTLSDPKLANYRGLVNTKIHKYVAPKMDRSQFNAVTNTTAQVAMDALKGRLGNVRNIADTVINNASGAFLNGTNLGNALNVFEGHNDLTGFIPKRMTVNAFFDSIDNYLDLLKNPNAWDIITSLASNTKLNSRETKNIFAGE